MEGNRPLNARQRKILDWINEKGSAQIRELSGVHGVSEATIRRDFDELSRAGLVERVHGGAVRMTGTTYERVHSEKMSLMLAEKLRIASYAASTVDDGDSLFLDSGTTTYFIAQELTRHKNLTILTNNLDIVQSVQFDPTVSLIVTGGIRRDQYSVLTGSITEQIIRNFCVDKAFMGCDAIDVKQGIFNTNFLEVGVKQCITRCGKKTILVTDSSKFHHKALAKVCDLQQIDMIITDNGLSNAAVQEIKKSVPHTVLV
jgi:DeoR family fructose operon transcriptional repressor